MQLHRPIKAFEKAFSTLSDSYQPALVAVLYIIRTPQPRRLRSKDLLLHVSRSPGGYYPGIVSMILVGSPTLLLLLQMLIDPRVLILGAVLVCIYISLICFTLYIQFTLSQVPTLLRSKQLCQGLQIVTSTQCSYRLRNIPPKSCVS